MIRWVLTIIMCMGAVLTWTPLSAQSSPKQTTASAFPGFFINNSRDVAKKPLVADPGVVAILPTMNGRVLFTANGPYFSATAPPPSSAARELEPSNNSQSNVVFHGGFSKEHASKRSIVPRLEDPMAGPINILQGPRDSWQIGVKGYQRLVYPDVWDGVDLVYLNTRNMLEFQVILKPGAEVDAVALRTGAQQLQLTAEGDLEAFHSGASARFEKPRAFQQVAGQRREVSVSYQTNAHDQYGYVLGPHDPGAPVTIHASIVWSTYVGGPGGSGEIATSVAVDAVGDIYLVGSLSGNDFPVTSGAFSEQFQGRQDTFVVKINGTTMQLTYATILGGSGSDFPTDIAIDGSNQAVVVGSTTSRDFPITPLAYQKTFAGGHQDGFVAKFSEDGSQLIFASYFGGTETDTYNAVDLDGSDILYLIGTTTSPDLPTTLDAVDPNYSGNWDTFYTVFLADGSDISACTYLGGNESDQAKDLVYDSSGYVFLAGDTRSQDFPLPQPPFRAPLKSSIQGESVYVCKLNTAGTQLVYTAFIDALQSDRCEGIAVDTTGHVYVTGNTDFLNWPRLTNETSPDAGNGSAAFAAKLAPDGLSLIYGVRFSGHLLDSGFGIAVDALGQATLAGFTRSNNFPTTPGAFSRESSGIGDFFVARLNAAGDAITEATLLGGSRADFLRAMAVSPSGSIVLAGYSYSLDFPTTMNAIQPELKAFQNAIIAVFSQDLSTLQYSTYLGSSGKDFVTALATDAASDVYIAGVSEAGTFPTTPGAFQDTNAGGFADVYVAKLNPDATAYRYATFLGGRAEDTPTGLAVDAQGFAYVTGETWSSNFPTTPQSFQPQFLDNRDVFVSKLNPTGTDLVYSTFLGTTDREQGGDIALDGQGNAVVSGITTSANFPTTPNAFQPNHGGDQDAFVVKLNAQGADLIFSSYLGGERDEEVTAVAIDGSGFIYVGGNTESDQFPTTSNALSTELSGDYDAFISKIHPQGSALWYSTFFGSLRKDSLYGMDIDRFGNVYITGSTNATTVPLALVPITPGAYREEPSPAFAAKLSTVIPLLHYGTYLGTEDSFINGDIAVNSRGEALIVGYGAFNLDATFCSPLTSPPPTFGTRSFLTQLNREGTGILYSTLIGANYKEMLSAVAVTPSQDVLIAGESQSGDLTTTPGVVGETPLGSVSGILAKISPTFPVTISPVSQALGLNPPMFQVQDDCGIAPVDSYLWRTYPTAAIVGQGNTITFDPVPSDTTQFDVTVFSHARSVTTRKAVLLIPQDPAFLDFNEDGCNSVQDLWDLTQFWNQPFPMDADGNNFIDIRDLLYIHIGAPCL